MRGVAGVDVTEVIQDEWLRELEQLRKESRDAVKRGWLEKQLRRKGRVLRQWNRTFMGCRLSPFQAVGFNMLGEEIVRGNRKVRDNALGLDRIKLNIPGQENYDPTQPWCIK